MLQIKGIIEKKMGYLTNALPVDSPEKTFPVLS
jgi:hypothetical protein